MAYSRDVSRVTDSLQRAPFGQNTLQRLNIQKNIKSLGRYGTLDRSFPLTLNSECIVSPIESDMPKAENERIINTVNGKVKSPCGQEGKESLSSAGTAVCCPICKLDIGCLAAEDRQRHSNKCLDSSVNSVCNEESAWISECITKSDVSNMLSGPGSIGLNSQQIYKKKRPIVNSESVVSAIITDLSRQDEGFAVPPKMVAPLFGKKKRGRNCQSNHKAVLREEISSLDSQIAELTKKRNSLLAKLKKLDMETSSKLRKVLIDQESRPVTIVIKLAFGDSLDLKDFHNGSEICHENLAWRATRPLWYASQMHADHLGLPSDERCHENFESLRVLKSQDETDRKEIVKFLEANKA